MPPMNGFRRREPSPDSVPNAIVGAARRIHIDRREEIQALRERGVDERQMLAWRYYDAIGEVKAAYNYFAAVGSRIRFYAGYSHDGGDHPAPIGDVGHIDRSLVTAARYELNKLNNGRGGQPSFVRAMLLNLLVAGECYIVGSNNKWSIRSTSEVRFEQDNKVRMVISRYQRGNFMHYLPEDAFIARVWRMHPQFSDDADAAMHGVLGECGELLLINRLIRASVRSRLSAGLLYVADELRFQRSNDPDGAEPEPDVDPFEEELTLALTDPIGDSDSPSEVVPLIIRGPSQFAENGIKLIDIGRGFDAVLVQRHDQTLKRIMTGLEIPQDMITGLSNVRYSNVGAISQDFLKSYLEPMAVLIAEAITTVFLRPALLARGFDEEQIRRVQVWYDPSAVVLTPDRSDAADNGYKQMLVSGAAWRRSHGFTDADAPSAEEIVRRVGLQGAVPPNAIVDMMRELAPELVEKAEKMAGHSMDQPVPGTNMTGMVPLGGDAKGQPSTDSNPSRNPALPSGGPGGRGPGSGVPGPRAKGEQDPMSNVQPGSGLPPKTTPTNPPLPPEGTKPTRAGQMSGDDAVHVPSERLDTGAILEMLQALTAAASEPDPIRQMNRRLEMALEVERRLRDQLSVHLNDVVRRALERAGARTVSRIRGDAELKGLVMDVPIEEAFANVPVARRADFALDDDRFVRDTVENAQHSFVRMVTREQRTGWQSLGVLDALRETQAQHVGQSWAWLSAQLVRIAKEFLHKPKRDDANYVPMQVVRDAMTLAGGGEHEPAPASSPAPRSRPQDSGRAVLSQHALDALSHPRASTTFADDDEHPRHDAPQVVFGRRYRWVYGISENHFEPHLALDGHVFESWQAGTLAAADAGQWPFTSHYYPGDHDGCRCDWLPEVIDVAATNAPERGDTTRIAASGG
jgi:hypothetical protein